MLGINDPDKLRRWTRDGKFDFSTLDPPIAPPHQDPDSPFQTRRLYTEEWLLAAAGQLGRPLDHRPLEEASDE